MLLFNIFLLFLIIIYIAWRNLDKENNFIKYKKLDYGSRFINRLCAFNLFVIRDYHRLGGVYLNIPENQGAIIVANHQSGMDPPIILAACHRPVRFLMAEDYYKLPIVKQICDIAKVIPVYSSKDNSKALEAAVEALKNGEIIGIFPFGGFHLADETEPRFRTGAAILSKLANVPIYPVYISGINKFSYKKVFTSMFFKRSKLTITQFKPVINNSEDPTKINQYLYPLISNHTDRSTIEDGNVYTNAKDLIYIQD